MSRSWCFTINNYDDEVLFWLPEVPCRYIVYGLEVGKQGTPHIQGYIEFSGPKRFAGVQKLLPKAHLEARKGTREQARDYCKKDGQWEEFGDWNAGGQGTRTDLDEVRQRAQEGGMRQVTLFANAQQIKVAEKFLTYHEEPRDWKPEVHWITGPTGSGKSRLAREGDEDTFTKSNGSKFWDGYDGHEKVIIDDFRPSWWELTETLSLLDRYEKRVEIKGGWRQFKPKTIVITSIKRPEECYKGCGEDIQQLLRRIDRVTTLSNEVEGVILEPLDI